MKNGFTLVELSIVLVIIGLLIGGILVGQSLIDSAKLNSTVQQLSQFDAAVSAFDSKFRSLPGDSELFGGDGDGVIDRSSFSPFDNSTNAFVCESANFFPNLNPSIFPGSSPCSAPGAQAQTSGSGKNVAESKMGKSGSFFIANSLVADNTELFTDNTVDENFYIILGPSQIQSITSLWYHTSPTNSDNSSTKPVNLLSLDNKLDDGLADAGNVLSGKINDAHANFGSPYALGETSCSNGADYQVQNDGYECTPIIRIGIHTGDLK